MGRKNAKRDAALYDAWVIINGKSGRASNSGFGTYLAAKYGISKQAVNQAIKRESERRAKSV